MSEREAEYHTDGERLAQLEAYIMDMDQTKAVDAMLGLLWRAYERIEGARGVEGRVGARSHTRQIGGMMNKKEASVWAVVFGNYYPREVCSLWHTKELAENEVRASGAQALRVINMPIFDEKDAAPPDCQIFMHNAVYEPDTTDTVFNPDTVREMG